MRIYLAGKVRWNGWRTELVPGAELVPFDDAPWSIITRAIFGEHDYVGPFLYDCGHGVGHGDCQHGMGLEIGLLTRAEVVRRCLDAVRRADLVFCWLEAPEDYGSMVELGYALALRKQVVIGAAAETETDCNPLIDSHWFVAEAASLVTAASPAEGLRAAIKLVEHALSSPDAPLPPDILNWCESPIESQLLTGLVNAARRRGLGLEVQGATVAAGPTKFSVGMQISVAGYRVDFTVSHAAAKAVVECDGHDYHERTKEQAKHDRGADRAFQRAGYRVLRFTGSEIYRDAEKCAVEVFSDLTRSTPCP